MRRTPVTTASTALLPQPAAPVIAAFAVALVTAAAAGYALRPLALRLGLVDRPAAHKAHDLPTPYLGGLAIAAGAFAACWAAVPRWDAGVTALAAGGAAMAALGLVDDVRPLRPAVKLAGAAAVAAAVTLSAGPVTITGLPADPLLAAAWIVVLTNSFNLLDNSDAAASAVGCVTALFLAAAAHVSGRPGIALLLAALSAACLGFLIPHNRAPARMFMGDAGSLFIGFVVCAGAVLGTAPGGAAADPAARITTLVLLTFVASVDTALVLVSRRRAGRSWLTGGTDHIAHRLRRLGLGANQAALALSCCASVACLAALLVTVKLLPAAATLAVAAALGAAAVRLLLRVEVYGPGRAAPPRRSRRTATVVPHPAAWGRAGDAGLAVPGIAPRPAGDGGPPGGGTPCPPYQVRT